MNKGSVTLYYIFLEINIFFKLLKIIFMKCITIQWEICNRSKFEKLKKKIENYYPDIIWSVQYHKNERKC